MKSYDITITIPVEVDCLTGRDIVFSEIERFFSEDTWRDGRYPFSRELLSHAMTSVLRQCVFQSVNRFFEVKYGHNTMEKIDDRTEINKAIMETEKWVSEHFKRLSISMENWKASATARME